MLIWFILILSKVADCLLFIFLTTRSTLYTKYVSCFTLKTITCTTNSKSFLMINECCILLKENSFPIRQFTENILPSKFRKVLACFQILLQTLISFVHAGYRLSKKSWSILYSKLIYIFGQDFLDIQYISSASSMQYALIHLLVLFDIDRILESLSSKGM